VNSTLFQVISLFIGCRWSFPAAAVSCSHNSPRSCTRGAPLCSLDVYHNDIHDFIPRFEITLSMIRQLFRLIGAVAGVTSMSAVVPFVVDCGSSSTKAGVGSSDTPYIVDKAVLASLGIDKVSEFRDDSLLFECCRCWRKFFRSVCTLCQSFCSAIRQCHQSV
jgi:hypothetical protein